MSRPEIKYLTQFEDLERALHEVNRPGNYYVAGRFAAPIPSLTVDPLGAVPLPVIEAQARELVGAAARAPYGRGPDTVLDRSVRDCWQIDAKRVSVSGERWQHAFRKMLRSVERGLGCATGSITAHLYKLLVYEPGGFFSEHRDTEKVDGMIGTLVLTVPGSATGGELVIRHAGREAVIDTCSEDPGDVCFAAFYADCLHRTEPVRTGHRVALVYNLVAVPSGRDVPSHAPNVAGQASEISRILTEWGSSTGCPHKIVWLLEHSYSKAGLRFGNLKGVDASVGETLARAAKQANCALHLAVLTVEEQGMPDDIVYDYRLADEIDLTGKGDFMVEVHDWSHTLNGLVAEDGGRVVLQGLPLLPEEALPQGAFDSVPPDRETLFEASGNEGATIERVYRRAALIVWPNHKEVLVRADASISDAIAFVRKAIRETSEAGSATTAPQELVAQLIEGWPRSQSEGIIPSWRPPANAGPEVITAMLELLSETTMSEQVAVFLRSVLLPAYGRWMDSTLIHFLQQADRDVLARFLGEFARQWVSKAPETALSLLARLRAELSASAGSGSIRSTAFEVAVHESVQGLELALEPHNDSNLPDWKRTKPTNLNVSTIVDWLSFSEGHVSEVDANRVSDLIARNPNLADPFRTLPKALGRVSRRLGEISGTSAYVAIWLTSTECLLERSGSPPTGPTDHRIAARSHCSCSDCRALERFCRNGQMVTSQFRVARMRRAHIRGVIRYNNLDIESQTLRVGRPYALVLKKVPTKYLQLCKEYAADIATMEVLAGSQPQCDQSAVEEALHRLNRAISIGREFRPHVENGQLE